MKLLQITSGEYSDFGLVCILGWDKEGDGGLENINKEYAAFKVEWDKKIKDLTNKLKDLIIEEIGEMPSPSKGMDILTNWHKKSWKIESKFVNENPMLNRFYAVEDFVAKVLIPRGWVKLEYDTLHD